MHVTAEHAMAAEFRQQRRVRIDDAAGKSGERHRSQTLQVSGQQYQVRGEFLKRCAQRLIQWDRPARSRRG